MITVFMTHLWQSTAFAAAAGLLTLVFRKNRAKVRFGLWFAASLKFFVPFALLINLGSRVEWKPAAHQVATVAFAVEYIAEPFSGTVSVDQPAAKAIDWMPIGLLAVWACGLLAILAIRLRLWLRVRDAVRFSTPLDIQATVGIRSSPELLEPGVVGLVKPVLLLPEGITARLSQSELEAVLAHELCHVRRRDNLFAMLHMIVEAVFWFHPLVWWIGARLVEERERACDEDVLSLGSQPRTYADAILNVCKLYAESPLVCVSGVTGSNIRRRIEAIMMNRSGETLNRAKKMLLASAAFAAVAGPVAVGILIGVGHVGSIHAQTPVAAPVPVQEIPAPAPARLVAQSNPTPAAIAPIGQATPVTRFQDRRLTAMLFDLRGMTADEQLRSQAAGIAFVQDQRPQEELISIMVATGDNGGVEVVQDFTNDTTLLSAGVQKALAAGGRSGGAGADDRYSLIAVVSKMLAAFPQKKALRYYSAGYGAENQAQMTNAIKAAQLANVAIFPIDARGGGPGRAMSTPLPAGVSQEEYDRRKAYVLAEFGSLSNPMSRTYLKYGPPDSAGGGSASGDVYSAAMKTWRYNYLNNFHSSAEFRFTRGGGATNAWHMDITYPPPAVVAGMLTSDTSLLPGTGSRETPSALATHVSAGLPARHTSMAVYPAGESSRLLVPLDSLSGVVDIIAQVKTRQPGQPEVPVATVRDNVTVSTGSQTSTYGGDFTLEAGSYVCRILVREASTGRIFTEVIQFDVR